MTFNDYQKETNKTAIYPDRGHNFVYPVLGMMGEGVQGQGVPRFCRWYLNLKLV